MDREQSTGALSTEVLAQKGKKWVLFSSFKEAYRKRLRKNGELLFDLLFGLAACFFASTHAAFGVYPFSIGLLLAGTARPVPILIGGVIGCYFLGEVGTLYLVLHLLAFALRLLFSRPTQRRRLASSEAYFEEALALRAVAGVVLGTLMALYELILFGVKSYTLLFAAGAVLLLPGVTLLFSFLTAQRPTLGLLLGRRTVSDDAAFSPAFGERSTFFLAVGGLFFLFVTSLSLAPYSFFGISVGKCVAAALTLLASRAFGAARGCVAGLAVGLAGELIYLPAFGLLGLLSGLYKNIGMPCALAASVLAGGGYAAYVGGVSGFLAVAPEMTVSALLLWAPLRAVGARQGSSVEDGAAPRDGAEKRALRDERGCEEETLACLSGAFATVSETIKQVVAEEKTPSAEEYESVCLSAKEALCRRCPADGTCHESEAVTAALRAAVIRLSIGEGVSDNGEGPCEGYARMLERIKHDTAELSRKKRLGGAKGALSTDYALLAEILKEATEARRAEGARDSAGEAALASALQAHALSAAEVEVVGRRSKSISLKDLRAMGGVAVDGPRIRAACLAALGASVGEIELIYEGGTLHARTASRPAFCATGGSYTLSGGREVSGDRAAYLTSENGMAYALLCDGMGSGAGAARAAEMGVSVLSALLSASVRKETALSLLNNVICSSEEECSLALDLLSIDLLSGRATFLKSGAAASFVQRGNSLFRIRSRTIPLGLLRIVDSEEAAFDVRTGDRMILLSDGVLGAHEDGGALKELLKRTVTDDCSLIARAIVEDAAARRDTHDDMTAVVIEIR